MGNAIGCKSQVGIAKQTALATAVAATDRIPVISESVNDNPQQIDHNYLNGYCGSKRMDKTLVAPSGNIECYIPFTVKDNTKFVSADILIALAMGTVTGFTAAEGDYNRLLPACDLNVFGTFGIHKGVHTDKVNELIGAMVNSMTISGTAGEAIKGSFELLAYQLKRASTTNTPTTLTALPKDLANLLLFNHLTFRLGDQTDALSASDNLGISAFTITVNNNLTSAEQTTPDNATTHTDPTKPIQPIRNGFREVTLQITVPRYNSDTYISAKVGDTLQQASFLFTDTSAPANVFNIFFPNLQVTETEDAISGAGVIAQTIKFKALQYNSDCPMVFSAGTDTYDESEIWFELSNERIAKLW